MSSNDESLGDVTPVETEDVTPPQVEPEDFDWDSFLSGVRRTRRAVKIYGRADLIAQMEELAGEFRDDMPAAQKRKIAADVTQMREEFEASGRWFVVEARSSDWQDKFRLDAAKRLGLDLGQDGDEPTPEQIEARRAVTLEQTAAQTVSPQGVDAKGLARLGDMAEGELNKIIVAVGMANAQTASSAGVLRRDFSPAPSAQKRGSAKR